MLAAQCPTFTQRHSGCVVAVHPTRGMLRIEHWLYAAWLRGEASCVDLDEATEIRRSGIDTFMAKFGF